MTIDKSMIKRLVTQIFPNGGDKYFDYEEEFNALCRAIEAAVQAEKQEPVCGHESCDCRGYCKRKQEPVNDEPRHAAPKAQAYTGEGSRNTVQHRASWMRCWVTLEITGLAQLYAPSPC